MYNEKKCNACELMDICIAYQAVADISVQLNRVMNNSMDGKLPFQNIIDTVAHDCKRFVPVRPGELTVNRG